MEPLKKLVPEDFINIIIVLFQTCITCDPFIVKVYYILGASLVAQIVKHLPTIWETRV